MANTQLQGWDKTFCLQYLEDDFDAIHFFGDKTYKVRSTANLRFAGFNFGQSVETPS